MVQKTSEKIISYIKEKQQVTANELVDFLGLSQRAVFKQLANLIAEEKLSKIGKSPKVFYFIKEIEIIKFDNPDISDSAIKIIQQNFLVITPDGQQKNGVEGFAYWCQKTKQPIEKTALEYEKTVQKYNAFKREGLVNGTAKIKSTFECANLDRLFYVDFYSIERFGKTRLGQMLLYAKQSQDKKLMKELIVDIEPRINQLIEKYNIDAIGFIPPTVKRQVQFMKELEKNVHYSARKISIIKAKTEISVPQKTLNNLADRIENARKTIIVDERSSFENILLIDDAVGSGATLNETAGQIKKKKICSGKIIGLAITGSFKGFDVISEV